MMMKQCYTMSSQIVHLSRRYMLKNRIDSSKINYCRKNLRTPSSVKSYSWKNNMTKNFALNCNLRRLRVLSSQMN